MSPVRDRWPGRFVHSRPTAGGLRRPQDRRFPDDSIDMGTGFDCFDTLANTADPRIGGDQAKNRLLLLEGLQRQGFVNYDKEWWHFTYAPAGVGALPRHLFRLPRRAGCPGPG